MSKYVYLTLFDTNWRLDFNKERTIYLLLCIKYKSPDAYSFLDFFSIQDALLDTARLLKFQIFFPARMLNSYTPFIVFKEF